MLIHLIAEPHFKPDFANSSVLTIRIYFMVEAPNSWSGAAVGRAFSLPGEGMRGRRHRGETRSPSQGRAACKNQVHHVLKVCFMFRHLISNREMEAFKDMDQHLRGFGEHLGIRGA